MYVCISVLVLIGNKADLEDQKQVDENEARTLAENLGLKYFETSAFNGQNVSKSVEALLDQVRLWLLIRGPFLERPGKFNGPGIIFRNQILKKSMRCVLTSNEAHFVSLANNFTVPFSKLLKLPYLMENKTA